MPRTATTTTAVACTCTTPWHQVWHRATLSVAASAVSRIYRTHYEAQQFDALFDGGEFSGPETERAVEAAIDDTLPRLGWTRAAYNDEIAARTSYRFAWFNGLLVRDPDAEQDSL
jgi:hypothetical protein